jgi:hypothetical protein
MARRGLSTLLIGLMTFLNGTVMLLGPGLHGLTGCGHQMVADRTVHSLDDCLKVASCRVDQASPCPVCEYLAQAQVVAEKVVIASRAASVPAVTVLSPISAEIRPQRTLGCRAPPSDSQV